ncbi:hypothetical protein HK096_002695, partial [Nowakowskiella sp. JEL0078]
MPSIQKPERGEIEDLGFFASSLNPDDVVFDKDSEMSDVATIQPVDLPGSIISENNVIVENSFESSNVNNLNSTAVLETVAPTVAEFENDPLSLLAKRVWLNTVEVAPFDHKFVVKIWLEELATSGFKLRKIILLEYLQYLEKYLWPNYSSESSLEHTLSISLLINEKFRQRISLPWSSLVIESSQFHFFFSQILRLLVDPPNTITLKIRTILLTFLINSFQSLEIPIVREECMKLVNIGIWHNLANKIKIENCVGADSSLIDSWVRFEKRFAKR